MTGEIARWEPWREFAKLQRRFNRMLDEFFDRHFAQEEPGPPAFSPQVDMYRSARGLVVRVALPGGVEEDIDVTLVEDSLVVRGELAPPLDALDGGQKLREWRYGYFERRILLPEGYDVAKVALEYHGGVLEIKLPRK